MDSLHGVGVALVTPLKETGEIDYIGLEKLLTYTADGGVDYYVVLGTTGESSTLFLQEKMEVLRFIKQNNPKKLPIVYGLGGNCTAAIAEKYKSFEEEVDAFLSVSPAYNKPSQEGIIKHYEELADAANHPIILYNVPGRTSSNMLASTTLELAKHPNIIGVKEASGSIQQCIEISENMPDGFLLISGDDMKTFPMIRKGACGVISVIANALPLEFSKMVHSALNGNDFESSAIDQMQRFDDLIMGECNPSGVKAVLKHLKICEDYVRLPLTKISPSLDEAIQKFLSEYK